MPELEGRARDIYIEFYTQETYDLYSDEDDDTVHGRNPPKRSHSSLPFSHRPDHDVESIFWVLVFAVMTALPKGAVDTPSQAFYEGMKYLRGHTIEEGALGDSRDWFFFRDSNDWKRMLHSKLSPIAKMMEDLAMQVYPEYGLLYPPPRPEHLHEAFRRILLNQILSMEDDIPLTPGVSRNPGLASSTLQQGTSRATLHAQSQNNTSKKRKANNDTSSSRASKTARSQSGVASFSLHKDQYRNN